MEQGIGRYEGQLGRFDTLVGWGFHVLGFESDPAEHLDAEQLAFLDSIGAKVVKITNDPDGGGFYDMDRTYESWFNENEMLKARDLAPRLHRLRRRLGHVRAPGAGRRPSRAASRPGAGEGLSAGRWVSERLEHHGTP